MEIAYRVQATTCCGQITQSEWDELVCDTISRQLTQRNRCLRNLIVRIQDIEVQWRIVHCVLSLRKWFPIFNARQQHSSECSVVGSFDRNIDNYSALHLMRNRSLSRMRCRSDGTEKKYTKTDGTCYHWSHGLRGTLGGVWITSSNDKLIIYEWGSNRAMKSAAIKWEFKVIPWMSIIAPKQTDNPTYVPFSVKIEPDKYVFGTFFLILSHSPSLLTFQIWSVKSRFPILDLRFWKSTWFWRAMRNIVNSKIVRLLEMSSNWVQRLFWCVLQNELAVY